MFQYELLRKQKESTLQLDISAPWGSGGNLQFKSVILGELSMGSGANYSSLFDVSAQEALSNKLAQLNLLTGAFESDIRLVTFQQTALFYINSDKVRFHVDVMLMAINPTDDVLTPFVGLQQLCTPRAASIGTVWGDAAFIKAPTDYHVDAKSGKAKGTASIRYSTWFLARNQLITRVDFTPSKAVIANGKPLYVTGRICFEPFRAITQEEFSGYFPKS